MKNLIIRKITALLNDLDTDTVLAVYHALSSLSERRAKWKKLN